MKLSTTARALILCVFLLGGAAIIARGDGPVQMLPRESLFAFPEEIGPWSRVAMKEISGDASDMLRVSDYVNGTYVRQGDGAIAGLYIGYHPDGGYHSPKHCLPGGGWLAVKGGRADFAVQAAEGGTEERAIGVSRVVVLKGTDKQVALYWYQGCGRVTASEYWNLIYSMMDKVRRGRTDGALVRIITPAASLEPEAEEAAVKVATDFAKDVFPLLRRYIPE